ncbi:hypothetical protein ACFL6P_00585 [Candidatus Latescibacterota bacterium]
MKPRWIRFHLFATVLFLLIITLGMARLFSGPEDTWIRNESGVWVRHGVPSGPPPQEGYTEPLHHILAPILILGTFPVFLILLLKYHKRLFQEHENHGHV